MRKKEFIERTLALYLEDSGGRFTLDDLATGLKCSKKTLYAHFGSKKELLYHLFLSYCDEVSRDLREIGRFQEIDILVYNETLKRMMEALSCLRESRLYRALASTGMFESLFEKFKVHVLRSSLMNVNEVFAASHQALVVELLCNRYFSDRPSFQRDIGDGELVDILTVFGTRTVDERRKKLSIFKTY